MNPIYQIFTGLLVTGSLLHAREPQILDDHFLADLRAEVVRTHPSAVAGIHKAAGAAQDVRAVRLWDDPTVGLGFMFAQKGMRTDEGDTIIGIDQMLPKPGMFEAEHRKMLAMQRAEQQNSRSAKLASSAEAASRAIELALADESISLQQEQVNWLTAMTENARQMAADPMGNSADALRMETELAKEQQMLDADRRMREGYAQRLNLTLGRPLDSPWPELKLPADPQPVPLAAAEVARIPHANPKIRSMYEMAAAANAETRIQDRNRLPQFSVGVETRVYSGGDLRSTMVGVKMNLPWFNESSYQAKISAARSREAAAVSDVEAMRREVAGEVLAAATEVANSGAQARAWSGEIHDKALKASQSIQASWISSKAPLTDLLDSRRVLFSIRLEQRRFIAMQLAALEELQTLVPKH